MLKPFLCHILHSRHLPDHRLEVKCPGSQAVLYSKDNNLSVSLYATWTEAAWYKKRIHESELTRASSFGRQGLQSPSSRQECWFNAPTAKPVFAAVLSTSYLQYLLTFHDWHEKPRKRIWCLCPSYQYETFFFGGRGMYPVAILIWICFHFTVLPQTSAVSRCQLNWMTSQ